MSRLTLELTLPEESKLVDKISLELMKSVIQEFSQNAINKWIKGHIEHGGNIMEADLLGEAIDENIDQMVYLMCLKRKLNL